MKRLILAGGGHAHLHVLKSLAQRTWPGVEVVLVTPHARQVYSGMLPGWIAGHYQLDECVAQLKPLVDAAGVRLIQDSVIGLDPRRRILRCAEAGELAYDVLSLDVGAQVDLPRWPPRPRPCCRYDLSNALLWMVAIPGR